MHINAMELHVYRLNDLEAPSRWRVLVIVRGEVIYRNSFNVETETDALRKALDDIETMRNGK